MPCALAASPYGPVTRKYRLITVLCACAAVSALAAGCGSTAASVTGSGPEKPDLTVAVVPATSVAGLYIAQQRGYFTAAGLHVKIVPVASGVNALPDLINGSVGQETAGVMALGTYPLAMTVSDLERVAVLMQDNGLLASSLSTTALAKGMIGR